MPHRLTVFTRTGKPLAELDAAVRCTWALNGAGTAHFALATRDAKCTERNLRFGNLLLVEHAALGSWGGFLWPPRAWQGGQLTVSALSAEALFARRCAPRAGAWQGKAGAIFRRLIDHANSQEDTNVIEGRLRGGGRPLLVELRAQSLADVLTELQAASGDEWWLQPAQDDDGHLHFRAHWDARRGVRRQLALIEGTNLALDALSEQGSLVNKVRVLGEGADPSIQPIGAAQNPRSRALYGLTEAVEFLNTSAEAALEARADQLLQREAFPRLHIRGALFGEETLGDIGLGDELAVHLDSAGFYGIQAIGAVLGARLTAMRYSSEEDSLAVRLEQTGFEEAKDSA